MIIEFLGNGSSGNATYFFDGKTSILIDNGLPLKRIPHAVNGGILLTHAHTDHCLGIERYLRKYGDKNGISCIVDRGFCVEQRVNEQYLHYEDFISGEPFFIKSIEVVPIGLWHDEVCFSFMLNRTYIHLTDTGSIPFTVLHHIKNNPINILYIESNYDDVLIEQSAYDTLLKRRIKSRYGHLSNQHVVSYLNKNEKALDKIKHIILGHLSENTNTVEVLEKHIKKNLSSSLRKKIIIGQEGTKIEL